MTLREEVERLLDQLSKPELETEYRRLQRAVAGEGAPDKWGELDDWSNAVCPTPSTTSTKAKVGFSWSMPLSMRRRGVYR